MSEQKKTVLILGANSDVAKCCILRYINLGYFVLAASRNTASLEEFSRENNLGNDKWNILFFDAADFSSHLSFYENLPQKPHVVLYAAGFLVENKIALQDFDAAQQMMKVNYMGAVFILNLIAMDKDNKNLEKIIGLSSLSGVRGRKSNFVYGSTKAAFVTYFAGLRQELFDRKISVHAFVLGYVDTKINSGLDLPKSLLMKPDYVAGKVVAARNRFVFVPNIKWKLIYFVLKILPESLVARLP